MKRSLILCGALFFATLLFAQESFLFRPVERMSNVKAIRSLENDPYSWVFWSEYSGGKHKILCQKHNEYGMAVFAEHLVLQSDTYALNFIDAVPATDGGVVILYGQSDENNFQTAYLEKLNAEGVPQWQGRELRQIYESKNPDLKICSNNNGGVFVCQSGRIYDGEYYYQTVLYLYNFSQNGINLIADNVHLSSPSFNNIRQLLQDGNGNFIINLDRGPDQHRILKCDAFGNLIGNNPWINANTELPPSVMIAVDADGSLLFYPKLEWHQGNQFKLRRQSATGVLSDLAIIPLQSSLQDIDLAFCKAADGGYFFAYEAADATNSFYHYLRHFKVDSALNLIWDQEIMQVNKSNIRFAKMEMGLDGNNFLWVTFISRAPYDNFGEFYFNEGYSTGFGGTGQGTSYGPMYYEHKHEKSMVNVNSTAHTFFLSNLGTQDRLIKDLSGLIRRDAQRDVMQSCLAGRMQNSYLYNLGENSIIVMSDTRNSKANIYYQIFDSNVQPLLAANGVRLNNETAANQSPYKIYESPRNTLCILYYIALPSYDYAIYLQEIDAAGNKLYPENGFHLGNTDDCVNTRADLSFDGEDTYVFFIPEMFDRPKLYLQKLTNQEPQFAEPGKLLFDAFYKEDFMVKGRYICTNNNGKTTIMRFTEDGEFDPAWDADGLQYFPSYHNYLASAQIIDDELYLLMQGTYPNSKLLLCKVMPEGSFGWEPETLLLAASTEGSVRLENLFVLGEELLIHYSSSENGQNTEKLLKVNRAGELLWGADGYPLPEEAFMGFVIPYPNLAFSYFWLDSDYDTELMHVYIDANENMSEIQTIEKIGYLQGITGLPGRAHFIWKNYVSHPWDASYAETEGRISTPSIPVSNPDHPGLQVPALLSLRNYPNPFKTSTRIEFEQKEQQPVRLGIYNLKGQLVHEKHINGVKGLNYYDWDAKDSRGKACAEGIYLFKVQTGRYSATRKMILMR